MQPELIKLLEQGFAAQQAGQLDAAKSCYLTVLARDEDNEFALNLLGVVAIRQGAWDEAIKFLGAAARVNPGDPETQSNLGLAYAGRGQFQTAALAFGESLRLNPTQPRVLNNLGNVLASAGEYASAINAFQSALALDGQYADCLGNLAMAQKEMGRTVDALATMDRALGLDPRNSQLHNKRGEVLLRSAQYELALAAFEQAISLASNSMAELNLATCLKQLGREQEALEQLERTVVAEPEDAEAHSYLGTLLEQMGNSRAAADQFREALRASPDHASSYYQLSRLKGQRLSDAERVRVADLLAQPELPPAERASLLFARGTEQEKDGEFAAAFASFASAQAIRAARQGYDRDAVEAYLAAVQQIFPVGPFPVESGDFVPVFVVGMPRSGTTLVEQVIASHSKVAGAGEVGFINELVNDLSEMTGQPFPDSATRLNREQVSSLRTQYFTRIAKRVTTLPFVVDKNPLNFNFLGIICAIFPEAKILYCRRDPMDNCVSIFRLPFDDNQGYAHDLQALGHYYRQHEALMAHWMALYPAQILTVQYEDTVASLEAQSRRLLEFIGLGFEPAVLQFYNQRRIVLTPSAGQVREPIYQRSVGSWKKYGKAVQPLADALGIDLENQLASQQQ